MRAWLTGFGIAVLTACVRAVADPVPVPFAVTTNTSFGQSVFVVGDAPALGAWDATRAVKLVASNCVGDVCAWSATVALPEGAAYAYKYIRRQDCDSCYSNTANVEWESGPDRGGVAPSGPTAPFNGKTLFYYSGWPAVSVIYSNTSSRAFEGRAMTDAGAGRGPGERLWRVDGLNTAGEPSLMFVFTDNAGGFDNPDGVAGRNYETPLDAALVQDGHVYNYWPAPAVSAPRLETAFRNSTNIAGRTIRVYLPRGYNEHTNRFYPVLYLHDGQNLFLGQGTFGCWNADTNAAREIRFGRMRESILVGIDNTAERLSEYQPPACLDGIADRYAGFLVDELKPYVDATYRSLPDADHTGTLGSSMGGLVSIYLGWEFPQVFRRIGAMSTAFWRCEDTMNALAVPPARPIRLYLDSGDTGDFTSDGLALSMQARDNLLRNGYVLNRDVDHTIGYGHNHNEYWWDRRLPRALQFLFPTRDEANRILDSTAHPPRLTAATAGVDSNAVTWTSYRGRRYTVETTDQLWPTPVWTAAVARAEAEDRSWDYPTASVSNAFRFLRIRQE
jgi:predicted alpha/beta superfamily hydrolase